MSDAISYHVGQLSPDGRWRWDGATWRPVAAASTVRVPSWLNLSLRRRATWVTVICALMVGVLTDQALRVGAFGLAASVVVVVSALMLAVAGSLRRIESRVLIATAALFAVWFSVRASPWLLWPDLLVTLVLLGLAGSNAGRGSIFNLGIAELTARAIHAAAHVSAGAAFIVRPAVEARSRFNALAPMARGLIIAVPIAALMSALLASADPVFASFFNLNINFGQLLLDPAFVAVGFLVMAGLFRLAASESLNRVDGPVWRLGATEALVVMVLLDAVFAAFAVAQVLAASGAAAQTLRSAGVTYADYARSGFFQLLWVGSITLVVLVVFSRITRFATREHRAAFVLLAEVAIALTLLIVAVAFSRLSLYEEAYGFTMLRLYSHIFAGWIAVVFLFLAADLLGVWRRRRWFVGAAGTTALVVLLALNFANPETLVVALNVKHAESSHKIDAGYFAELSGDATPAILDFAPLLDPPLRRQVHDVVCAGSHSYSPSLTAFNWAEAQAAAARRAKC